MKYPTCPQTPFERPSATQKDRQSATETLITWIVPLTPVLGRAEESVDSAPTHQTDVPVVAENSLSGAVLWLAGTGVPRTRQPPKRTIAPTMKTLRGVALIQGADRT